MPIANKKICPICLKGTLVESDEMRTIIPNREHITVTLKTSICDHCGETMKTAEQHKANLGILSDVIESHKLIDSSSIIKLRWRYGLKQEQLAKILGISRTSVCRYEKKESYPNKKTRNILRSAIESMDAMKELADKAGIELPLWKERCEDAQDRPNQQGENNGWL